MWFHFSQCSLYASPLSSAVPGLMNFILCVQAADMQKPLQPCSLEDCQSSIYFPLVMFLEKSGFDVLNEVYRGFSGFKTKNTRTQTNCKQAGK